MNDLEQTAKNHFNKLKGSIEYHNRRLDDPNIADGVKHMVRREVEALDFIMSLAKDQLKSEGVDTSQL